MCLSYCSLVSSVVGYIHGTLLGVTQKLLSYVETAYQDTFFLSRKENLID